MESYILEIHSNEDFDLIENEEEREELKAIYNLIKSNIDTLDVGDRLLYRKSMLGILTMNELSRFIDENLYLHFENISAYSLSNNKAKSILNKENNLIDANYIDDVSNDIANIFDKLLDEEYGE